MVNKVILVGNVGKDPEIQHISADVAVAKFTLATSESYRDKNGERVTNTEWHNIVAWRGLAKVIEQYVHKGSQLYIEGKIANRSYEKDGQTKYVYEIIANEIKILGKRPDSEGYSSQTSQSAGQARQPSHVNEPVPDFSAGVEDDLPF
jgi:single-strand DNA-binding protein